VRRSPLLIPAIGIGCGVWAGDTFTFPLSLLLWAVLSVLAFRFSGTRYFWVLLFLVACLTGNFFLQREAAWNGRPQKKVAYLKAGPACLKGVVLKDPFLERKGQVVKFKFLFEVRYGKAEETIWVTLINASGVILRGDELVIVGELAEVSRRGGYPVGPRFRFLGIGKQSYFVIRKHRLRPSLFDPLRHYLASRFEDLLPDPESGILRAMILGDRAPVEKKWNDILSRLGVIHILCVSGFHMAVIGWLLYSLGRLTLLGPRFSIAVALVGLVFYYFLSGQAAPSLRSLIMAFAFFSGRLLGREGNALNALSLAFIISLFIEPSEFFSLSFQLSYLTVLGLVLIFTVLPKARERRPARNILGRFGHHCLELGRASLTAFLFSFGLVAHYFGTISIATVLVNAVLSPVFTLIVIFGFLLCPASGLGDGVGGFFSLLVYLPTHLFLGIAERLSTMPLFRSRGGVFSAEATAIYYFCLAGLFCLILYRKKLRVWLFDLFNRRLGKVFSKC